MDAESQLLADKDAEIERLLTKSEKDKNILLISLESATKEIERLKSDHQIVRNFLDNADSKLREHETLITDLVDELDFWEQSEGFLWGEPELKKRAREATR